MHLKIYTTERY